MERFCGLVDYRLKKMGTLSSVSRSMILGKSESLRSQDNQPSIRTFKEAVQAKKNVELRWNEGLREKFSAGADEKQVLAQQKEEKRLNILEELKEVGGPFTNSEEVETLLNGPLSENEKKKRLKKELQYARDSSITLPKTDQIFKIQITLPSKKRRDKNAKEMSESLITYLGNFGRRRSLQFETFQSALDKIISAQTNFSMF